MRNDSRLSRMLHVLLHMARQAKPFTSEQIGEMLKTNPVVVRRTMAGLRDAGYVTSVTGPGGGWTIACDLEKTTLLDIQKAVGGPNLFVIGIDNPNPVCAVEQAVNAALSEAMERAERMLLDRLGEVSLASLAIHFGGLCEGNHGSAK
ncbi:Rrf2 family transcriptional regulator [Mesorhizobium sp. M1423]|uniref:Rrf2 family transcriptional regulator n=1 Tax=Mesorhizobium sp. M1423 TaxID=2957101 RepID=UPI003337C309